MPDDLRVTRPSLIWRCWLDDVKNMRPVSSNNWSKNFDKRPQRMLCPYWGLNGIWSPSLCAIMDNWMIPLLRTPLPMLFGGRNIVMTHILTGGSWGPHESAPKWYLDHWLRRFCTVHHCDWHTDTEHATCDSCSKGHVLCMRWWCSICVSYGHMKFVEIPSLNAFFGL